jgi:arabinogalactan endo-1,4-beta-galactosidase
MNTIRLRLWNHPKQEDYNTNSSANPYTPYCNLSGVAAMAKRAVANGLGFLLDFHYSDTWADPGKFAVELCGCVVS